MVNCNMAAASRSLWLDGVAAEGDFCVFVRRRRVEEESNEDHAPAERDVMDGPMLLVNVVVVEGGRNVRLQLQLRLGTKALPGHSDNNKSSRGSSVESKTWRREDIILE